MVSDGCRSRRTLLVIYFLACKIMNKRILKYHAFSIAMIAALFITCNHYNPFSDVSNADIDIVAKSFNSEDTVSIFSTQTITFRVLVKELVSDIQITSPGNRLWNSTDTTFTSSQILSETITLDFSWPDTGMQTITFSIGTKHEEKLRHFSLYTTSLLNQDTVKGHRGGSFQLQTTPVPDKDVGYYWSLGNSTQYISQHCSTLIQLNPSMSEGVGAVWVSDGTYTSPIDSFYFFVSDTVSPLIACLSDDNNRGDTILTGDPLYTLRVSISDQDGAPVDSASFNGKAFDRKDGTMYTAVIENVERYAAQPLAVHIYALDRYSFGNESRDTVFIRYIDTLPQSIPVNISVMAPNKDTTTVGTEMYDIFGILESNSGENLPVTLIAYVNDSIPVQPLVIRESHAFWEWRLPLVPGFNDIRVVATQQQDGRFLDRTGFVLRYIPDSPDSTPPNIAAIMVGGKQAHNLYTTKPTVRIGVKAFDEHGWMDTLYINETVSGPDPENPGWYYGDVSLQHTPGGNEVVVRAIDTKGNESKKTAVIFRNRPPLVETHAMPAFILVDSLYTDTVIAFDPDGDSVTIKKEHGPADLLITPQGIVYWVPTPADTGTHTVTARIWDGYQPVYETFTLVVSQKAEDHPGPIRFATRAEDFPVYLEIGTDTLCMPLGISRGTGVAPWSFTTRLVRNDSLLQHSTQDSILRWVPTIADTGYQQLVVTVTDIFPGSDTLYPRILVISGNNPCSLSVGYGGAVTPNGTFDLNSGQKPDTLVFHIHDKDPQITERYSLSIYQARSRLYSTIDSALVDTLALVVDPRAFDGYDTVVVTVEDRKQNVDTLRQTLYYGMPPAFEKEFSPANQTEIISEDVIFSWNASDLDGDFIWYELYLGRSQDSLERIKSTPSSHTTVSGLERGIYYWYVVAHDWKSSTTSSLLQFEYK